METFRLIGNAKIGYQVTHSRADGYEFKATFPTAALARRQLVELLGEDRAKKIKLERV